MKLFAYLIVYVMIKKLVYKVYQNIRVLFYILISDRKYNYSINSFKQPVLLKGRGVIEVSKTAIIGVLSSPFFLSSYSYIESRNKNSKIVIGNNVIVNNNVTIVSEGEGIVIGDNTLIGHDVEIVDSDFHELSPNKRIGGNPKTKKVIIGKNVFIGNYVKITKGVEIGENTVVAMGAVVVTSVPDNCVVGGNPAIIIRDNL